MRLSHHAVVENGRSPERPNIAEIVEDVAHYLPEQTPLHTFVHHNTLHAFEDLPFEQALLEAASRFGTQPYPPESFFAQQLRNGRIQLTDVEAVVKEWTKGNDRANVPFLENGPSLHEFVGVRLRHLFEIPRGQSLEWQLAETNLLREIHALVDPTRRRSLQAQAERLYAGPPREREPKMLLELWRNLESAAGRRARSAPERIRRRDQLLALGAEDVDGRVHPLLIRLTAAFLDQGISYWSMPRRDEGLLVAFRELYRLNLGPPDPWMRGLTRTLQRQHEEDLDAVGTIHEALERLGVPEASWSSTIHATAYALRGFAGMVRQFEVRPDRAPVEPRPARLIDFLAVQLTLDAFASTHVLERTLGKDATWDQLEERVAERDEHSDRSLVYEAYLLAQIAPVPIARLRERANARLWVETVRRIDEVTRRRLLHRAYERRLRMHVFDGLLAHDRMPARQPPSPRFQAVFCIDDRECSTRRHLEESHPSVETFGYAGFFGVAMAWQGLGEVRPRPLCPVNVTPRHYVTERALSEAEEASYRNARRLRGLATHAVGVGSRTLGRGSLVSSLFGLLSVVPLVGRCLFPRWFEHLSHRLVDATARQPVTRLVLEREGDARDEHGRHRGYSVAEMTDVVENALRTMSFTSFCPIVLIVGHGSSSLNNPHEAAYDCGATGGGRGGPNARAFAAMANHPGVREGLERRGIAIPATTWFVGAYHNTCDDHVSWFDEELLPEERMADLEIAKQAMRDACELDAHERSRRFLSAPRTKEPELAMRHVEARAVDLAQPRPEYCHATNAVAIVGRRARTRGLYLDRRAFLVSYDPARDPEGRILEDLLGAVVPVGAGINLEYFFSFVDPLGYGCGSKLSHNICGLVGVMDGHASDLRTGLSMQMVEIHEPVRLLSIVEARPETLLAIFERRPALAAFVRNGWVQLACLHPESSEILAFEEGEFRPHTPESTTLPVVTNSAEFYQGQHGNLWLARIQGAFGSGSESETGTGGEA